jgi:acetyltransferase-like isoleucine patch superfamily enzyme
MGRPRKRFIGHLVSHGMHCVIGPHPHYYTVTMTFDVTNSDDRQMDFAFRNPEHAERVGASLMVYAHKARIQNIELEYKRFLHNGGRTDVHTEHCCSHHGCKYGEEERCPVTNGNKPQHGSCDQCQDELEHLEKLEEEAL